MKYRLLMNECLYSIFSAYLLSFARAIAEVGAVAMVGGAIAWKTNVMTTAIMMYTNRGSFTPKKLFAAQLCCAVKQHGCFAIYSLQ